MNKALVNVAFFVLAVVTSTTSFGAESVVIRMQNGRQLTASVHQRTDNVHLWLQYGTRSTTILRPLAWQEIDTVTYQGEPISFPQLKALAQRPVQSTQPVTSPQRDIRVPPASDRVRSATMADRARQALGFSDRVRSLQIDAAAANWDGDVETDGLMLRLFPMNDQGEYVAVAGTLQVEFTGRRQRDFNDAPQHRGSKAGRIGRWSVKLDEADFRQGVATVKLPFQAIHPDFDTTWFANGLVHVRLTVAGVGTFEQSVDGVRTRPFSPFRDTLQSQSGNRFLSSEQTSRR